MVHGSEKAKLLVSAAALLLAPLAAIAQAPPGAASPEPIADEREAETALPEEPSAPAAAVAE